MTDENNFLAGPIGTNCYLLINEKTKEAVIR